MRPAARTLSLLATAFLCAGLALATLTGLLAPVEPLADLINHFRLHLIFAAGLSCLAAAIMGGRWLTRISIIVLLINLLLAAPAFYFVAPHAQADAQKIRILSFNTGSRIDRSEQIEAMLREQDADMALLLEVEPGEAATLERLRDLYPYQVDCAQIHLCRLALLSKHEIVQADTHGREGLNPTYLTGEVMLAGSSVSILGVHLTRPFLHSGQREELDFLADRIEDTTGPMIMLGDFNLTPWSWEMSRLQARTGLLRHRTLGFSWPANRPPLFPQLLIDHILTRGPVATISTYTGPDTGSDHLPVIADLTMSRTP